jgi:hypothetical protein
MIDNFPVHSVPEGDVSRAVDLRFWLSSAEVENIEAIRHRSPTSTFALHVAVEPSIAWVKTYNQMGQAALPDSPWDMNFGMFSQLFPFWTCRVTTIQVEIDQSHWIDSVLPGLGYDRLRLLELTFPPTLPDHSNAAAQFDKARKALDQRRYGAADRLAQFGAFMGFPWDDRRPSRPSGCNPKCCSRGCERRTRWVSDPPVIRWLHS